MKRYYSLLAVCVLAVTFVIGSTYVNAESVPSIKLISPKKSGVIWKKDKEYNIVYRTKGMAGVDLTFALKNGPQNSPEAGFILGTKEAGTTTSTLKVKIPTAVPDGLYDLYISGRKDGVVVSTTSAYQISVQGEDVETDFPTITITNPTASTTWNTKTAQKVEWNHTGGKKLKLNLVLYNVDTTQHYVIKQNINNKGNVAVPKSLLKTVPMGNYEVRLRNVNATSSVITLGKSEVFSITKDMVMDSPKINSVKAKNGNKIMVNQDVVIKGKNFSSTDNTITIYKGIGNNESVEGIVPGKFDSSENNKKIIFMLAEQTCDSNGNSCTYLAKGDYKIAVTGKSGTSNKVNFKVQ